MKKYILLSLIFGMLGYASGDYFMAGDPESEFNNGKTAKVVDKIKYSNRKSEMSSWPEWKKQLYVERRMKYLGATINSY